MSVELRPLIGQTRINGVTYDVKHDIDLLMLDGKQIATINRVPGAAIRLLGRVVLSPSQQNEIACAVAKERGGVRPSRIIHAVTLPGELLDEDDSEPETDLEVDDE